MEQSAQLTGTPSKFVGVHVDTKQLMFVQPNMTGLTHSMVQGVDVLAK